MKFLSRFFKTENLICIIIVGVHEYDNNRTY